MSEPSRDRDPFEAVAESFLARYRAGERPGIDEYADRHPELADQIRRLLPALVLVEQDLSGSGDAAPPPRDAAGGPSRRLGDYRIVREVGRGGMGVVYEAEQISLGRRVALKVLPGHVAGDRRALERFRREAKAAARLHHTNIVPVFEVGSDGDVAYYAMQFIQGQGLDQVIDELARLRRRDERPADGDREGSGRPAGSADGPETAGVTAALVPIRELGPVAESLLGGRLGTEGATAAAGDAGAATEAETSDPAATSIAAARDVARPLPGPPRAAGSPPSAVLPGGTSFSSADSSGRRQPFFRGAAQVGRQAAQGLAYAHSRGVIHRDIKPSNLLLDTAGVVWIADFGLAKAEDDGLTATGDILGTLRYMAPERFRGQGDARADIYALGLTLYELLTLRPAHDVAHRLELIERVKREEPPRPRSLDARVPRDLETIVLKAIDKDPARRYATAGAMAEDLRRFLDDEPIAARRASATERLARWARHHPGIAALGAVLTAVLLVATVASLVVAGRMAGLADEATRRATAEIAARADADRAREAAKRAREAAARQAAALLLDRGIEDARGGEPARALHLFVRALRALPADDPRAAPLGRAIRANLTAWAGTVPALEHIWPDGFRSTKAAFSPDGRWLAVAAGEDEIRCFRTDTGRPVGPPVKIDTNQDAPMKFAAGGRSVWFASTDRANSMDRWAIHRLDPVSGRPVRPPIASTGPVTDLAVTPDGRHLVASVRGLRPDDRGDEPDAYRSRRWRTSAIVVWETATGRVARKVDVDAENDGQTPNYWPDAYLGLSHDGKSVIAWVRRAANRFEQIRFAVVGSEPPVPQELPEVGDGAPLTIHFEDGMRTALVIKDGRLHRWSATAPGALGPGIPAPFRSLHYNPSSDGRSVTSPADGRLYDIGTWPPRPTGVRFAHPAWQRSPDARMEQSADGQFAATWVSANHGSGRLWRLPRPHSRPAPAETAQRPVSTAGSTDAEFDPGGASAILWPYQRARWSQAAEKTHVVRLVDVATGAARTTGVRHTGLVREVVCAPDGRHFATASFDATARAWETATGRPAGPPLRHGNYVATVAFSPDGKTLAAGDYGPKGLVRFWDWRAGKEVRPPLPHDDIILGVTFSPDGRYLAVVKAKDWSRKPEFLIWEVASGTVTFRVGYLGPSHHFREAPRFRPDSRAVALRDASGVLRLWEVPSGRLLGERSLDGDGRTRFSPDGRVVAAAANLGVRLLDGEALAPLPAGWLPHPDPITDVAFSPDGASLLTAHEDGSAQLWDVATRKPVGPPAVLLGPILAARFAPDGRTCLCVAADGTVRRWPVPAPFAEPDVARLADRVALMTGQRMDDNQGLDAVPADEWQSLRTRLVGDGSTALVPPWSEADWHDAVAADAEQDRDVSGAEWHLDRLAALRPGDWTIPARRGRFLARAGRRAEAAAAYAAARSLAPSPRDLADWLRAAAADEEAAGRSDAVLWDLDRAVESTPEDWVPHAARAAAADRAGHPERATTDADAAIRLGAEAWVIVQMADRAASRAARTADWARVATLLSTAVARDPVLPIDDRYHLAIACRKAGDRAGYRAACAGIAGRMPTAGTPPELAEVIPATMAFLVGPGATEEWSIPRSWADRVLAQLDEREAADPSLKEKLRPRRYQFLLFRGAMLHRAGRAAEATAALREALAVLPDGGESTGWLFLALAEHARGRADAAKAAAARARAVRPATTIGPAWDRAGGELLAGELDAVVPPPGPVRAVRPTGRHQPSARLSVATVATTRALILPGRPYRPRNIVRTGKSTGRASRSLFRDRPQHHRRLGAARRRSQHPWLASMGSTEAAEKSLFGSMRPSELVDINSSRRRERLAPSVGPIQPAAGPARSAGPGQRPQAGTGRSDDPATIGTRTGRAD